MVSYNVPKWCAYNTEVMPVQLIKIFNIVHIVLDPNTFEVNFRVNSQV